MAAAAPIPLIFRVNVFQAFPRYTLTSLVLLVPGYFSVPPDSSRPNTVLTVCGEARDLLERIRDAVYEYRPNSLSNTNRLAEYPFPSFVLRPWPLYRVSSLKGWDETNLKLSEGLVT